MRNKNIKMDNSGLETNKQKKTLTISAINGSSGLGSAIRSWTELSTVEMFSEGLHAPYEKKIFTSFHNYASAGHMYQYHILAVLCNFVYQSFLLIT